jgi:hypothetical protein
LKKYFLLEISLVICWILTASVLVIRLYSLRFNAPPNILLFWLPFIILVAITGFFSFTRHHRLPMVLILGLALILRSISVLSLPVNIPLSKDVIHDFSIASRGLSQGNFVFGDSHFVSHSFDQSFYPGLEFFTSSLNLVTATPLIAIYNYSFLFIGLLTLFSFSFLLRLVMKDTKTINLAILLYSLCPSFVGFNSATVHESLAIILIPVVISAVLINYASSFKYKKALYIAAILSIVIVGITNEFSIYILTLFVSIIVLTPIIANVIWKKKYSIRQYYEKLGLLSVCLLTLFLWLIFEANYYLKLHGNLISRIFSLFDPIKGESVSLVQGRPPLPFFESFFSYAGFGLFLLFSVIGVFLFIRSKKNLSSNQIDRIALILWSLTSVGLLVLWKIIPWEALAENPISYRILEFSYFGMAIFAALSIIEFMDLKLLSLKKATRIIPLGQIFSVIVIVIIAVPIVTIEFTADQYDSQPPIHMDNLHTDEAYFTSKFVGNFINSTLIAGTEDGEVFISGYSGKPFSYSALIETIKNGTILADTYYINLANIKISDQSYFTLGENTSVWLNSQLDRIYDTGSTLILAKG